MTLFQARFIQWLTITGCTARVTAGTYYARYNVDGTQKKIKEEYNGLMSNQLYGVDLRMSALKVLECHGIEPYFDSMGTDIEDYEEWRKNTK